MFHMPPAMRPYSKFSEPDSSGSGTTYYHTNLEQIGSASNHITCARHSLHTVMYIASPWSFRLGILCAPAHAPPMCHSVTINFEVHLYVKSCLYHVRTYIYMPQLAVIAPFTVGRLSARRGNKKDFDASVAACGAIEPRQHLWTKSVSFVSGYYF